MVSKRKIRINRLLRGLFLLKDQVQNAIEACAGSTSDTQELQFLESALEGMQATISAAIAKSGRF